MLNVKANIDGVIKALGKLEKQTTKATAIALTKTAKHAQRMMYDEFKGQFDRPTPLVMKSLFIEPATKDNLSSRVYMKDRALGGKNMRSMSELLAHHFTGGRRVSKAFEDLLRRNNYLAAGELVVPGSAAKLDGYGNINRGQIVQIISQLGIARPGFDSTPTKSKRSRRNVARAGVIFWSRGPEGKRTPLVDKATGIEYGYTGGAANHLPKGAWVRNGRTVRPLLIVVKSASYRRRFDFQRTGQAAVDRHFNAEFKAAMALLKTPFQ